MKTNQKISSDMLPLEAHNKLDFDFNFDGLISSFALAGIGYRALSKLVFASFVRTDCDRNQAVDILDIFFSAGKNINILATCLGYFEVYRDYQSALPDPENFADNFNEVMTSLCDALSGIAASSIAELNQDSMESLVIALESAMKELGISSGQCWDAQRRMTEI